VRVAIVGIGGVGKEYARVLEELGVPYHLVDYNWVIREQTSGGELHNRFPGHEFSLRLSECEQLAGFIAADGGPYMLLNYFRNLSITHVVHATPPMSRELFEIAMSRKNGGPQYHLVEKPYCSSWVEDEITVGYLYRHLDIQAQQNVTLIAPRQMGWRSDMALSPLLWDLGGHALSVINPNWWEHLHVLAATDVRIALVGPLNVFVGYDAEPVAQVDDHPLDWNAAFKRQMQAFLNNEPHEGGAQFAYGLEAELIRIEGEIDDLRLTGGPATE